MSSIIINVSILPDREQVQEGPREKVHQEKTKEGKKKVNFKLITEWEGLANCA